MQVFCWKGSNSGLREKWDAAGWFLFIQSPVSRLLFSTCTTYPSRVGVTWDLEQLVALLFGPCLMPRRHFSLSFFDHGKTDIKYVIGGVSQLEIINIYHQFFRLMVTVLMYVVYETDRAWKSVLHNQYVILPSSLVQEAEGLLFLSPYLSRTLRSGVCRLEDARCEIGTTCQAWQGGSFQQGSVKANKLFWSTRTIGNWKIHPALCQHHRFKSSVPMERCHRGLSGWPGSSQGLALLPISVSAS